jgi:hypothetical protein
MKTTFVKFIIVTLAFSLSACFKDIDRTFDEATLIEFNDAVINSSAAGKRYPLIAVNNGAGAQKARINLVGRQRNNEEIIRFEVDQAASTAVAGVHYQLTSEGTVTLPANSSFAEIGLEVLEAPEAKGTTVEVVLVLVGNDNGTIKPSENYKRVGYRITL